MRVHDINLTLIISHLVMQNYYQYIHISYFT